MTDRPIIFSTDMVKALSAGIKTQTRRLATSPLAKAQTGDRLWVREAFGDVNLYGRPGILYRADGHRWDLMDDETYLEDDGSMNYNHPHAKKYNWLAWVDDLESGVEGRWRPSIHMPRWVSRAWLAVTNIRLEPLQSISQEDAIAEGLVRTTNPSDHSQQWAHLGAFVRSPSGAGIAAEASMLADTPEQAFAKLWDSLHCGKPGEAWADNPDIVAVTFAVVGRNIDGGER
ncbi:MAG: hypothetical protein AAFW60_00510 [Pseudomonadota bacterium]